MLSSLPCSAVSVARARAADEPFQIDGFFRRFPPSPPSARSPSGSVRPPLAPLHLLHGVWSPACSLCSGPQAPSTRAARQSFQDTNSYQRTEFCYSYGIACVNFHAVRIGNKYFLNQDRWWYFSNCLKAAIQRNRNLLSLSPECPSLPLTPPLRALSVSHLPSQPKIVDRPAATNGRLRIPPHSLLICL